MQPWVSGFQDLCAISALIILLVFRIYKNKVEVDKRIIYVFGCITFIPLVQYLFGILFFTQELVLSLIYISVFFLGIISGANFNKLFKDIERLSFFFVFISLSCVVLQLIQWSGLYHSVLILDSTSRRPFANLGQPNNLATLLFIGFFSNIILFKNYKIKVQFYYIVSIALMIGIVLTQSRTSWVVFFAILLLTLFKKQWNIFSTLLRSAVLFFCLVLTLPYITLFFHDQGLTVTQRISSDSTRLHIWKQMLIAIMDRPWFGYGWNQTPVAQTSASLKFPLIRWFEYSHNLFLDIIVWTGIPIGVSIIIIISIWLFKTFIRINTSNQLMYFLIITAFFIHCMLEYPFAYAYFLLPIGFYIGVLHREIYDAKAIKVNALIIFLISLLTISVSIVTRDYFVFNKKKAIYASENLFSQKVKPVSSKILLLDALDINNDIMFLDECYVLNNSKPKNIERAFYSYPTNSNLIMYYKSELYSQGNINKPMKYAGLRFRNISSISELKNNCL
ncbi:PglL family O-oligosaccharyltransferase [Psychrobacter sp. NG254]|uniref:PglL family O-oligosaccharyltransferase n=1 Tax=Psychrobacter sp. NG254 TaxID=2782003 RepID=UPI001D127163|nr:O-antigen ligase family protein [Psychrobacter sp. NG254]